MSVYLDHAATAGMSEVALAAYDAAATVVGNPSSLHFAGRAARNIVEDARESIAADLGAHPTEVVFTSGGTESNNVAIKGIYWAQVARDPTRRALMVSAMEHHSVLSPARWLAKQGADLTVLPVDDFGFLDPKRLTVILREVAESREPSELQVLEPALVSVMLASNEIGTIQPIQQLAEIAHSANTLFHTDAVAALGQIPISFTELGVDALSVAAHKIGGPLGVGTLLVKRELPIEPLHHGGDQERGLRAGTINVPGVAGFAAALRVATAQLVENDSQLEMLRDELIAGVLDRIPTAILTGPCRPSVEEGQRPVSKPRAGTMPSHRLPANASFIFPGCDPDALLFGLDNQGIAASIGAACAAGVAQASEALLACGFSDAEARSSLRFTLGPNTSLPDVERLIQVLPAIVQAAKTS